jgi:hypothetical protein
MIWASGYWKEDIEKIAERMRKRSVQTRWTERSFVNLEKDIFIVFYSLRKLLEASKISDSVADMKLSIFSYHSIGKGVTKINWHRVDEHFDLKKEKPEHSDLRFICNQIVHSYIFMPQMAETNTLAGILFCSDFKRNSELYRLEISEIIRCLELVAADDISSIHAVYDFKSKDYKITSSS